MPLLDLILKDLSKSISDSLIEFTENRPYSSQEDAYSAGVAHAQEGAEKYLREIFPDK